MSRTVNIDQMTQVVVSARITRSDEPPKNSSGLKGPIPKWAIYTTPYIIPSLCITLYRFEPEIVHNSSWEADAGNGFERLKILEKNLELAAEREIKALVFRENNTKRITGRSPWEYAGRAIEEPLNFRKGLSLSFFFQYNARAAREKTTAMHYVHKYKTPLFIRKSCNDVIYRWEWGCK